MPEARQHPTPVQNVLVVSSSAETREGLHAYFSQTGLAVVTRRTLNMVADLPGSLQAIVVFPDDFAAHEAVAYLSTIRSRRPELTMVIVTREPLAYTTDGTPLRAIVLPRPAFGWTILDAIRGALHASSEP